MQASEMNAFATGRERPLVAVSKALTDGMIPEQMEAVLGHEVMRAANGDMVTLALIQGVMNALVIFRSRYLVPCWTVLSAARTATNGAENSQQRGRLRCKAEQAHWHRRWRINGRINVGMPRSHSGASFDGY
jgi:hypothetical protein